MPRGRNQPNGRRANRSRNGLMPPNGMGLAGGIGLINTWPVTALTEGRPSRETPGMLNKLVADAADCHARARWKTFHKKARKALSADTWLTLVASITHTIHKKMTNLTIVTISRFNWHQLKRNQRNWWCLTVLQAKRFDFLWSICFIWTDSLELTTKLLITP